jgi:hypothetical protein
MTKLADFLASLSEAERDYIANLDYEREVDEHRRQLDIVIAKGGAVDLENQLWYPYEVIDLGKHCLFKGHEREFVACNGIVLLNLSRGNDRSNDVEWVLLNFLTYRPVLDQKLAEMIKELGRMAMDGLGGQIHRAVGQDAPGN